jgi:hypothetical protein
MKIPNFKLKKSNPRPIPRDFLSIVYENNERKAKKIPFKFFQRKIKGLE